MHAHSPFINANEQLQTLVMMKPSSEPRDEPKYRGVRLRKWGKWVSEIRLPNSRERIWLGSYDSPKKDARAFDAAAFCLRGSYAKFNFPDKPPNIPGGTTLSPSRIQAAAARFANSFPETVNSVKTHTSTSTSSSFVLHENDIFSGLDDYFMPPPPPPPMVYSMFPEYDEKNSSDGDISQGPSFLWNF